MRSIQKILIHRSSGKKFMVKDTAVNFHTQFGMIKASSLKSRGNIESSEGEKFSIIEPSFADLWEQLTRGPQVMIQKDIGLILAKTGVNKHSEVVDAGGGSGSLCLALANICKGITTYEINPEHYDILSKNKELCGMKNLIVRQDTIYDGIKEKNLDLITLDLPEPWRVTEDAVKALNEGGYLVVYLPNLNQVKIFIDSTKGTAIRVMETVELLERKWNITEKTMRPEFEMLGHTGFLTFCRKI